MAQTEARPARFWKLAVPEDFEQLPDHGFLATGLDRTDGYVHNSMDEVLETIANRFYKGRNDVLLLKIDPNKCGGAAGIEWRDTAPEHNEVKQDKAILHQTETGFVHIYLNDTNGQLKGINPDAIVKQHQLEMLADGTLVLPDLNLI